MFLQKTGPRVIPADRRCLEVKVNGQQCRGITVPGEKWCHMHGKYHALHNGYSSISVPVLEDEDSILFVLSQVARALAGGSIPASNANGIVACCRMAERLVAEKRKQARSEPRQQESGMGREADAAEVSGAAIETETGVAVAAVEGDVAANCEVQVVSSTASEAVREAAGFGDPGETWQPACDEEEPQRWTVEPYDPDRKVVAPPQFADAPQHFQDTLDRMEGKMLDVVLKRNKERRAREAAGWGGV